METVMGDTVEVGGELLALTPMFDGTQVPARTGVYRRAWPAGPYSCWADGMWFGDEATPDGAARAELPSRHRDAAWQGLSEPHDHPCTTCRGLGVLDRGTLNDSGEDLIDDCPDCGPT